MQPLTPRPVDELTPRLVLAHRKARRTRNVGILAIVVLAAACVGASTAIVWRASGQSIAWSILAFALGLLLAMLWAILLTNFWCATVKRMSEDYQRHLMQTRPRT